jgi:hypothetical protein
MKLNDDELKTLQDLNKEFNKLTHSLGTLALQKHSVLKKIDAVKESFEHVEKTLLEKYGEDAVVHIETGQITQKE